MLLMLLNHMSVHNIGHIDRYLQMSTEVVLTICFPLEFKQKLPPF